MSLSERQAELVETHRAVHDADLPYVLVGGWAVSAFQTRFTTDVDMVIPETALEEYDELLRIYLHQGSRRRHLDPLRAVVPKVRFCAGHSSN